MEVGLSLTPRAEGCRGPRAPERHQVVLIAITDHRKWMILCPVVHPRIPLRQRDKLPLVGDRPLQAQAGKRALHSTDNGQWALVVVHHVWRIDDDTDLVLHFSTSP